ncbi:helix-turn-helix transcriptional regulator [Actinoplanes sp. LDG1-06]|uniref:Helix-turn-helix transcriptional regulator n=1 Tax=Paractinoplanes ovalisporus TaxID=2810368 RepID=A0ABS2A318_9ACTN|nr:AraC family transcriptional regulator [Actinoplanes ovalisporus]MBM2614222.1 helix-turn-helix transcriptional regulator [Actinoplanes ovalisporus]
MTTDSRHTEAVVRAIDTMRSGLGRPQPLAELSRAARFSRFHFHKMFRELTAVTPARYLAALRMAEARRLLLHSTLPVRHVGARVGYQSPGTFSVQFSRLVGVPPARFRDLVRSLADERSGARTPPRAEPGRAATPVMALSTPPRRGSLVYGCLIGDGSADLWRGRWTVATGDSRIPLPSPPAAGEYAAFLLVVAEGARHADALVDDVPGSYRIGRGVLSLPDRRTAVTVHTSLRGPEPTDPPIVALTPPQWR